MCRCMLETSSVPPRKSSATFGNLRKVFGKCSETLVKPSEQFLENLRKSSETGRKSSENRQKRRYKYVYIINRILHARFWI